MQHVRHVKLPPAQVHFGPTGRVTVIGMPMDPHFQSAYYPAEGGNVFGVASMTTPEGVDVCPRSEDLGRVVGERLLASSWGQRHFFFDLDEVDADFEGACLRLKSRLNP